MVWKIEFRRATPRRRKTQGNARVSNALKDAKKLKAANLQENFRRLIEVLKENPYQPAYEKLMGNLRGYYSRRINIKHRLIYSIDDVTQTIRIVSVWSHYE